METPSRIPTTLSSTVLGTLSASVIEQLSEWYGPLCRPDNNKLRFENSYFTAYQSWLDNWNAPPPHDYNDALSSDAGYSSDEVPPANFMFF